MRTQHNTLQSFVLALVVALLGVYQVAVLLPWHSAFQANAQTITAETLLPTQNATIVAGCTVKAVETQPLTGNIVSVSECSGNGTAAIDLGGACGAVNTLGQDVVVAAFSNETLACLWFNQLSSA